jgi:hypothetical protein
MKVEIVKGYIAQSRMSRGHAWSSLCEATTLNMARIQKSKSDDPETRILRVTELQEVVE